MRRINISLRDSESDALYLLSVRERRDPREQAALLIRQELVKLGILNPASDDEASISETDQSSTSITPQTSDNTG